MLYARPYSIPYGITYGVPYSIPDGLRYGIPRGIPCGPPHGLSYGVLYGMRYDTCLGNTHRYLKKTNTKSEAIDGTQGAHTHTHTPVIMKSIICNAPDLKMSSQSSVKPRTYLSIVKARAFKVRRVSIWSVGPKINRGSQ